MKAALALLAIGAAIYGWAVHTSLLPAKLLQTMQAMTLC
jgi:hypothetical protein